MYLKNLGGGSSKKKYTLHNFGKISGLSGQRVPETFLKCKISCRSRSRPYTMQYSDSYFEKAEIKSSTTYHCVPFALLFQNVSVFKFWSISGISVLFFFKNCSSTGLLLKKWKIYNHCLILMFDSSNEASWCTDYNTKKPKLFSINPRRKKIDECRKGP